MEQFLDLIANVGFPIAVTAFLLLRIENKLDSLLVSIDRLNSNLSIRGCPYEKDH